MIVTFYFRTWHGANGCERDCHIKFHPDGQPGDETQMVLDFANGVKLQNAAHYRGGLQYIIDNDRFKEIVVNEPTRNS
jgi:hypothetical protein